MSGLFAVVTNGDIGKSQIDIGVEKLCSEKTFYVNRYGNSEQNVTIGRVGNGILNAEQPKKSKDQRYWAFIEGEIYNAKEIWSSLGLEQKSNDNDADLILALNQTASMPNWIGRCCGSFTMIIWDSVERNLWIGNDRFGFRPHYYSIVGKTFLFGPKVKFLLHFEKLSKTLDLRSVVDYFAFQGILDDRTFFRDIKLLSYATVLKVKIDDLAIAESRYWDFDRLHIQKQISFDEAVAETAALFDKAVEQQTRGNHRIGLLLSGGLDSRLILGCMKNKTNSINAFTYGLKNSRDLFYAARMCRYTGAKHHRIVIDSGHWLMDIAEKYMRLTEGFQSLFHAHAFNAMPRLCDYMDINMSGFFGDPIMGGTKIIKNLHKDDWSSLARSLYKYCLKQGIGFTTDYELRQLFTDKVWKDSERVSAWESFVNSLERFKAFEFNNVADFFHILHRARKQLLYMSVATRPYFEDRVPFYDYELFDYVYSIPVHYKLRRQLQGGVLDTLAPKLARIPDSLGKVMYTSQRVPRTVERTKRGICEVLTKLSGGRIKDLNKEYQEYSKWLRNDIGMWAKEILVSERTFDRGLFSPDFIRSTLNEHLNGKEDCLWKIGLMLSFEIMLRQLVD